MEWLYLVGIIVFWYVLNRWILPRMGIQTWMSDSCQLPRDGQQKEEPGDKPGTS